jgi:hypothetical protein
LDFKKDLRKWIFKKFEKIGFTISKKAYGLDLETLLTHYQDYFVQWISPTPRKVFISSELNTKLSDYAMISNSLGKLKKWVEDGVDINCFHSRTRKKELNMDSDFAKNQYQFLLYGVTHLHMSVHPNDLIPKVEKDGFSKWNENLLLAMFNKKIAYFIDIIKHPTIDSDQIGWFVRNQMIIIENNWPELIDVFRLPRNIKPEHDIDDEGIGQLIKAGINTIIDTGKNLYTPRYGVTSAGTDAQTHRWVMMELDRVELIELWVKENFNQLRSELSQICNDYDLTWNNKIDFHYSYYENEDIFLVLETNSQIAYHPQKNVWLIPSK